MTVKTGQKCTAIRRAIIPADKLDAVAEAMISRLPKTTLGNPSNETVRMGPLASIEQRKDVKQQLSKLTQDNKILFGRSTELELLDAYADKGAFMSPVLMCAENSATTSAHDIEAFAELSGDKFYAHMDEVAAIRNPFFEGRVAHGVTSLFQWQQVYLCGLMKVLYCLTMMY